MGVDGLDGRWRAWRRIFAKAGKGEVFEALKVYLVGEVGAPAYAEVAERLGMSEGAVKVAVHRLRERYRAALRREIAATVRDEAEVDRESRICSRRSGAKRRVEWKRPGGTTYPVYQVDHSAGR